MGRCFGCGYMWADLDEDGTPITREYCHYEGPDEWALCAEEEYELEPDPAEDWFAEMEQAIADEDYRSSVEYYGAPYDYQEF